MTQERLKQHPRDELLERAKHGEITGAEADAEAVKLGLGSLSRRPPADQFRPESMPHWTLPMVFAWIIHLDLDAVREWCAPYREECWHWVWQRWRIGFDGPVHEGWLLEQRGKPTLALLGIGAALAGAEAQQSMSMSFGDAQESLWIMLRDGFLKASGIDMATNRRVEIPPLEWHELVPVEGPGQVDEVRRGPLGTGYREVLIPSAPVRGYWRRKQAPTYSLPEVTPPAGHGYMPLFCAAHWIAAEGGQRNFDPGDSAVWQLAFEVLLGAITSNLVDVVGINGRQPTPVPSNLFVGIQVDYPFSDSTLDLMLSDELVLRSYPYIDDQHWRNGFDDALVDRTGDHWRRLMVRKDDVGGLWPFTGIDTDQNTGLPGRPSKSKHLIEDELRRRAENNLLAGTLADEAAELLAWLVGNHSSKQRPTLDTIKNNIRAEYRRLKNGTK